MKDLFDALASPKLVIAVFALLVLGLGAGTVFETLFGPDTAARAAYHSWWLLGLLELFGACLVAALIVRYPWGWKRLGFALTHGAIALILVGAAWTFQRGIEGEVSIEKGQRSNEVIKRDSQGDAIRRIRLPFAIQLEDFTVDQYPGSRQPAGYRSDVKVIRADGTTSSASIWMNHELSVLDWRFYQSRYLAEGDSVTTVLFAARDPGRPWVFLGYALLLAGLGVVLASRVAQSRKRSLPKMPTQPARRNSRAVALSLAATLLLPAAYLARTVPESHDPVLEKLRRLPVQHDGRVMPLDTVAREAVRHVHGTNTWQSVDPVTTLLSWAFDESMPSSAPLRESLRCMPSSEGAHTWTVPVLSRLDELSAIATGPRLIGWPSAASIEQEIRYNRWQPTRLAWLAFVAAGLLLAFAWRRGSNVLDRCAALSFIVGFCSHTWGIATRWRIAGHIPATNMYESLMFLAWGVGVIALVLLPWMRHRSLLLNACGLSALTLALADLLPLDPFIHPMPPVLAGTPWLAIHVPIIMLSYSILALGVLMAHVQIGITIWAPKSQRSIQSAYDSLYWYIHIGCLLLTAGIITGSVWAASSWGRYWGWDPKEVWSLVALLAYLALLHARRERLLSPFAFAAISILAFQTILMTYLGVNFVLGTGLHSYAMGDSPVARWMLLAATLEVAFLVFAVAARKRRVRAIRQPV